MQEKEAYQLIMDNIGCINSATVMTMSVTMIPAVIMTMGENRHVKYGLGLCYLMTLRLRLDIRCHVWKCFF